MRVQLRKMPFSYFVQLVKKNKKTLDYAYAGGGDNLRLYTTVVHTKAILSKCAKQISSADR